MNTITRSYSVVKKLVFDSQVIVLILTAKKLLPSVHVFLRTQLAYGVIGRKHAEVITLDFQRAVEACAKIFQGDCCCQFDDLFGTEQRLNFCEYSIGNIGWCPRHALGIAQHGFFSMIKVWTRLKG